MASVEVKALPHEQQAAYDAYASQLVVFEPEPQPVAPRVQPTPQSPLAGLRVLLLGSQYAVVEMQRRVLHGAGADVVTRQNLSGAARVGFAGFDLVVLNDTTTDKIRPQMVYQWVAKQRPDWVRKLLIVFSAEHECNRAFVERCQAHCIYQPFGAGELLDNAQAVLAAGNPQLKHHLVS